MKRNRKEYKPKQEVEEQQVDMRSRSPKAGFRIFKFMTEAKDEKVLINTVRNLNEAYKFIKEYERWSYSTRMKYHKVMIEWDDPVERGLKHYIDFAIDHQNECREINPETAKIYDSNDPMFRPRW